MWGVVDIDLGLCNKEGQGDSTSCGSLMFYDIVEELRRSRREGFWTEPCELKRVRQRYEREAAKPPD